MSKSTPLGAVAKFAGGGKKVGKKDIAQRVVYQRWDVYEKLASRTASEFPPDPRRETRGA